MRNKGTLSLRHHREPRLLERDDQFKISIVYNHEFWVYLQKVQQMMRQLMTDPLQAEDFIPSWSMHQNIHTVSQSYITYYHTV